MKSSKKGILAAALSCGAAVAFAVILDGSATSSTSLDPLVVAPSSATSTSTSPLATYPASTASVQYDWSQVDDAIQTSAVNNLKFVVGNSSGRLFMTTKGTPVGDKPTDLASGSKLLVGALAMRMVQDGKIKLEDRAHQYLDFASNDADDPTLEQLLSLQAGFNSQPLYGGCVSITTGLTLQDCAKTIYTTRMNYDAVPGSESRGLPFSHSTPGALFSYGPHHLQVAAAMLEKAGGKPFPQLFRDYVTTPLGMSQTRYVIVVEPTNLIRSDPTSPDPTNPWAAGGGESTVDDYEKLLNSLLGTSFITDVDGFTRARTLGVRRGYVPTAAANWEYALGTFVECTENHPGVATRTDCSQNVNSSPGAYGWLGWIDRSVGYYGLIATHTATESDPASIALEKVLQCEIKHALRYPNPVGKIAPSGCPRPAPLLSSLNVDGL